MSALRILVLGGTRFVGRHIVDAFVAANAEVTLFHRGISDPSRRTDVGNVLGDRVEHLGALREKDFDAVIDTSGYTPDVVHRSARFFESRANRYLFVSSLSVYDFARVHSDRMDEDAPLLDLPADVDPTVRTDEHYGALKTLCESEVRETFGERAAILRLGLVAGPHDPTDRFTYWVLRAAAGGEMLAPPADRNIQYADARDVAQFALTIVRDGIGGTYNVAAPPDAYTFGDLIAECARVSGAHPNTRWVEESVLIDNGVQPWSELPLWIPRGDAAAALLRATPERAVARGLQCTPLAQTVRDTFAWASNARTLDALQAGLSRSREKELLEAAGR
ncbi:MAG TPA: NAD-dependent epimerase/dehydratase family protein [Candidatus Rubrimentiphilum sp.]|nr:NAD-dependent epimerase/dehydratase family protein [Candidatus Rubrimentiphilum sp.]